MGSRERVNRLHVRRKLLLPGAVFALLFSVPTTPDLRLAAVPGAPAAGDQGEAPRHRLAAREELELPRLTAAR